MIKYPPVNFSHIKAIVSSRIFSNQQLRSMANPSLDYAALSTLNLWLMSDSYIHNALQMDFRDTKLNAIQSGAARFGYAKELDSKFDLECGLSRFEPALDVIDPLNVEQFLDETVESVQSVSKSISSRYGNSDVFSATTKLLWLKFLDPIVIYDRQAAESLGTKLTRQYYERWYARFEFHKPNVANACESLVQALRYVYDPATATREYVEELAITEWFQHRVFGTYLTFVGRNAINDAE